MKKQIGNFKTKIMIFTGVLVLGIFCSGFLVNDLDEKVKSAYNLRIGGEVDEAKTLLDQIIDKDSTNAMAWFELARTQHHMMLGGAGYSPEDILTSVNKAVHYDMDNVIYAYYQANICFLNAYSSKENTSDFVSKSCEAFENVLKLKPDYKEAILTLVEIYGLLPIEMGGDKSEAESYASSLDGLDKFYYEKANAILMAEDADKISYWEKISKENPGNARVMEELGKAYIFNDDIENGMMYMEKAAQLNPENYIPQINMARVYVMMLMQNKGDKEKNLELAQNAFKQYLEKNPDEINPLKAYSLGWIAKINGFEGNSEEAKKLSAEAKSLDPYFSRAFGIPPGYLYSSPVDLSDSYSSYFSPF